MKKHIALVLVLVFALVAISYAAAEQDAVVDIRVGIGDFVLAVLSLEDRVTSYNTYMHLGLSTTTEKEWRDQIALIHSYGLMLILMDKGRIVETTLAVAGDDSDFYAEQSASFTAHYQEVSAQLDADSSMLEELVLSAVADQEIAEEEHHSISEQSLQLQQSLLHGLLVLPK